MQKPSSEVVRIFHGSVVHRMRHLAQVISWCAVLLAEPPSREASVLHFDKSGSLTMNTVANTLLFPGEKDFVSVPLEAMASRKLVIVLGKGGALETVLPVNFVTFCEDPSSPTGVFFYEQTEKGLIEAFQVFEKRRSEFQPDAIRAYAKAFDPACIKEQIQHVIMTKYDEFSLALPC